MQINREFISQQNINGTGNPCKYIVIHETDNYSKGAGARTHAKAQHDGNFADMSVHYYCGSDGIYQAAEHTCKCWHIGREYGGNHSVHDATNNNSIGIEICVNQDGNYTTARQNAIELVKYLLQTTGIPASRVIRHFDAKGKYCPRKMMDNPALWTDFKAQIQGGASTTTPSQPSGGSGSYGTGMYKVNVDDLAIRTGPSTKYTQCGSITDHGTYTITEVQNTCWGKLMSGAGWICIDADYCAPAGAAGGSTGNVDTSTNTPTIGGTVYMFNCPQISYGSQGNAVLLAQEILKARGYYKGALDRLYGNQMKEAVVKYQTDRAGGAGPVDGIIGPKCWADMIAL
jgi:N-acetylmuramoyl-L-alanine amidase CwlA